MDVSAPKLESSPKKSWLASFFTWGFALFWNIFLIPFWYAIATGKMKAGGGGSVYIGYAVIAFFQLIGFALIYLAVKVGKAGKAVFDTVPGGIVKSSAKGGAVMMVFFAVFWNGISWIAFAAMMTGDKDMPLFAKIIVGLFLVVGIFLIYKAVLSIMQAVRFGSIALVMDPNPGSIGGEAGGSIELSVPFKLDNRFDVSISCIHSVTTGSGKNRSTTKTLLWQEKKVATQEMSQKGTLLKFKFSIPDNMPESEEPSSNYRYWTINVTSGDIAGIDLSQSFNVEVRRTEAPLKSSVKEDAAAALDAAMRPPRGVIIGADSSGGMRFFYPSRRNRGAAVFLFGMVAVFAVGPFIGFHILGRLSGGAHPGMFGPFAPVFIGTGALVVLVFAALAVLVVFGSLEVIVSGASVRSVGRVLGFTISRREMALADIDAFEYKTTAQAGDPEAGNVKVSIYARSKTGQKIIVANGLLGFADAANVKSMFESLTGKGKAG
ncbi:MAG: hypothetical protein OEV59_09385 [Deltaproteobacteria bacterium]|nr:hypothetical protein [Deltaproteobacteria bacterium]